MSIIVPIKQPKKNALEDLLGEIGADVLSNRYIDFSKLTTTHFLRWVILPATQAADKPLLAFESNHDGSKEEYLDELIQESGPALREIYSHCEEYQQEYDRNPLALREYLLQHEEPPTAFFQAYAGWTVQRIRRNARVRKRFRRLADSLRSQGRLLRLRRSWSPRVRQVIRRAPRLKPVPSRPPRSMRARLAEKILDSRLGRCGLGILLAPGLVGLHALFSYQEWTERRKARTTAGHEPPMKRAKVEIEDRSTAQTPLTHLVDIKPGRCRLQVLQWTLTFVQFLSRCSFNEGKLGDSTAIHFARWTILKAPDQRRQLLFFSNYDGSWERYLGDFIDRSSRWLNAVWNHTQGFPKTRLLLWKGAKNAEEFKQWVSECQHPTQVWYSAHADKSVRNILDDIRLCSKLGTRVTRREQKKLLGML